MQACCKNVHHVFCVSQAEAVTSSQAVGKEELWVDKYSPKTFLDLLSDEVINKEVLKWLKSWDHSVLGPSRSPTRTLHRGQLRPVKGPAEQKILLMSGAPGIPTDLHGLIRLDARNYISCPLVCRHHLQRSQCYLECLDLSVPYRLS